MKQLILTTLLLLSLCLGVSAASWTNMKSNYSDEYVVYVGLENADGYLISTGSIAAFIGDECRGEATALSMQTQNSSLSFFTLRIGGTAADNGQSITFKYVDEAGNVYTLNNSANPLSYSNEDTKGTLSDLYKMNLTPAMSIYMDQAITMNAGEQIDVRDYVKPYPEGAQLPEDMTFTSSDESFIAPVSPGSSIFKALKANKNTYVEVKAAMNNLPGTIEKNCSTTVTILQPITSIKIADEYKNVTVELGDNTGLRKIVSGCYTANPADATERVVLSSSDETVIKMVLNKTTLVMVPQTQGPGTCVLTISSPDGKISDNMTITVIKPVEEIGYQTSSLITEVGDNLKELMDANISILPADASDLTYTITSNNTEVVDNNLNVVGVGSAELTVATSYKGANGPLTQKITIYANGKHSLSVVNKTLAFSEKTSNEVVSEQMAANLSWAPNSASVVMDTDNPKVLDCGIGSGKAWGEIIGKGEANVTVTMYYQKDKLENGQIVLSNLQLVETFKVIVSEALSGFAIADIRMGNTDSQTINITPQPAGAEYDKSKISVVVEDPYSNNNPQKWELASVAASGSTRLKWTVKAKSVGSSYIHVLYDGQVMGTARVEIGQTIKPEAGWKWVSVYTTSANVQEIYGDNLIEARGEYEIVHNDPVYGYFGDLYRMTFMGGYKVKNEAAADSYVLFREGGSNDPYYFPHGSFSLPVHPKWNWIGSPYQYDHAIEDVFPKALDGDRIVSKTNGFAEYRNGEWVGTLTTIKAGLAYIYYSNQTENAAQKEFQFRAENEFPQGTPVANAKGMKAANSVWSYDDSAFADNMSMIASADVDNADNYTVGAFVGDECRGEGESVDGKFFVTVHGKTGEQVTFKLYNKTTGSYVGIANTIRLAQAVGTCSAPVRLDIEDAATSVDAAGAAAGSAIVTVRTLGGAAVDCTDIEALPAGAYIVISKDANGKTATRKIVK